MKDIVGTRSVKCVKKQYFAECMFGVQIVEYTRLRVNTNVNDVQRIFFMDDTIQY